MFRLLVAGSLRIRYFLRRYMPTNILADAIHTKRGMKWGPVTMLLAIPYFAVAVWLVGLIEQGAPGWLHLLVLLTVWNGCKMLWLGPASVAWLIRTRLGEAGGRRRQRRAAARGTDLTVEQGAPEQAGVACWVGSP